MQRDHPAEDGRGALALAQASDGSVVLDDGDERVRLAPEVLELLLLGPGLGSGLGLGLGLGLGWGLGLGSGLGLGQG